MKINRIEFKNFLSYGDTPTIIDFSNDSQMIEVSGKSGAGKSTINLAILYALYGKSGDVSINDLPNRLNKKLYVKINFTVRGADIEIERGIKPNVFNVKINNEPFDKAGKKSVQEYLESEFYDIDYNIFRNTMILSVNNFKSFLTMSIADKRKIIDKMFGFYVYNEMLTYLRSERNLNKINFNVSNANIENIKNNITKTENLIKEIENELNLLEDDRDSEIKKSIENIKNQIKSENEAHKAIQEALTKLKKVYEKYNKENNKLQISITSKINQLNLYNDNKCPTCECDLDSEFHNDRKHNIETEIEKDKLSIENIKNDIKKIQKKNEEVNSKYIESKSKLNSYKNEISRLEIELKERKDSVKEDETLKKLKKIIIDSEKEMEVEIENYNRLLYNDNVFNHIDNILGENGVKKIALQRILPILNYNLNIILKELNMRFDVHFDDKFNCKVIDLGEEINPLTMSTGERKKVDFAIVLSIIKIIKLRWPELNLLFLDELLSSIDGAGIYDILKILKNFSKEYNFNTFVINHSELPLELFDQRFIIYKENSFSKIDKISL